VAQVILHLDQEVRLLVLHLDLEIRKKVIHMIQENVRLQHMYLKKVLENHYLRNDALFLGERQIFNQMV